MDDLNYLVMREQIETLQEEVSSLKKEMLFLRYLVYFLLTFLLILNCLHSVYF